MRARRRALLSATHGRVLEIGAGTGLNLAHYPAAVRELVVAEPAARMRTLLERRATGRATVSAAAAEVLPFADGSFDFRGLHDGALHGGRHERRRRGDPPRAGPGGRLLFIEHLRSNSPRLARWQDRLEAPWRVFGEGCRCNQPTLALLAAGGLQVERLERDRWRGMPPVVSPLALGQAHG